MRPGLPLYNSIVLSYAADPIGPETVAAAGDLYPIYQAATRRVFVTYFSYSAIFFVLCLPRIPPGSGTAFAAEEHKAPLSPIRIKRFRLELC
jgi:hypothetical protein